MQLAGTREADRRAGRADAQRPGSLLPRTVGLADRHWRLAAPAPGADGGSCNAGCRPEGPAANGHGQRSAANPGIRRGPSDPALRVRVRPGRLHGRHQHLGTVRAKHIVKARENFASRSCSTKRTCRPCSPSTSSRLRACWVTQAVRVGGHAGQMHPAGVQFDEEQHVQPPQPHRVDGEEVAGNDPGGLPPQKHLPVVAARRGAGSRPWRRSVVRIAVAETRIPSRCSSPLMRW